MGTRMKKKSKKRKKRSKKKKRKKRRKKRSRMRMKMRRNNSHELACLSLNHPPSGTPFTVLILPNIMRSSAFLKKEVIRPHTFFHKICLYRKKKKKKKKKKVLSLIPLL